MAKRPTSPRNKAKSHPLDELAMRDEPTPARSDRSLEVLDVVTAIVPDPRRKVWVTIKGRSGVLAKAPKSVLADAELGTGAEWSAHTQALLAAAMQRFRCRERAIKLLGVRARSEAMLTARLEAAGFEHEVIKETLTRLKKENLVNDEAFAAQTAHRSAHERREGAALIQARIEHEGISEGTALRAVKPFARSGSELERATAVAKSSLAKLPGTLSSPAKAKRVLSAVARKGFDEETALEATRRALGRLPESFVD